MFERFFPASGQNPAQGPLDLMERMMRQPFSTLAGDVDFTPRVDVKQTGDQVLVSAELPGLDPADVDLTIEDTRLTIAGSKTDKAEAAPNESVVSREIRYGRFSRTLTLPAPVNADGATASFDKGVLTIAIPKAESVKASRIPNIG